MLPVSKEVISFYMSNPDFIENRNEKSILNLVRWYFNSKGSSLKAPISTAADDNFHSIYLFIFFFFRETKSWHFMWIVCRQTIHMKFKTYFIWKKKNKWINKV